MPIMMLHYNACDNDDDDDDDDDDRFPNVIVPFTKTEKWERIRH